MQFYIIFTIKFTYKTKEFFFQHILHYILFKLSLESLVRTW